MKEGVLSGGWHESVEEPRGPSLFLPPHKSLDFLLVQGTKIVSIPLCLSSLEDGA